MLISRITDENEGTGEGKVIEVESVSSQEYQTANELFELMTTNRHFEDDNDDDSLTTRDLVLLYKNIDKGTRLLSDATEVRRRRPNQHVETVVYNDEPESDSDISENFSIDDLHNVFKINQERLNLFEHGSFDNILCHKLGGLEIQTSDVTTDYNRQFLFKDPYIKEQLKGLNVMASSSEFENLVPTSLLDYICCKRLEDNYTFYMDNIIRYVQHTIEQLKRISNGEYLTDRAKEKWEGVDKKDTSQNSNTKVLSTSTSIPLHVECKKRGNVTWDDIVHSEVDVRSLSKILEKKIVVEIPKLICGSYRLFSKRCADNLIISCKRQKHDKDPKNDSRVDVVLKLQRSQTGQVISNISSIMILQSTPAMQDLRIPIVLPITYNNSADETADDDSKVVSVVECTKDEIQVEPEIDTNAVTEEVITELFAHSNSLNDVSVVETNDYPSSDPECVVPFDMISNQYSSESSVALRDILVDKPGMFQMRNEATFNLISPDELRVTMQRLHMQTSLPEESGEDLMTVVSSKKKSPVRVRIKSPYENKSYIMEEKKRKRLLEIREKREKKKIALGENAKVSKHKYGKAVITPQASSSVTKLSITNKSFYNSIYGQNPHDGKTKTNPRKGYRKDSLVLEVPIEHIQEEYFESPNLTPDKNSKKYINRSYYLDDTETEIMFTQMRQADNNHVKNTCSASTSAVSNEFSANLTLLSQLIGRSDVDINTENSIDDEENRSFNNIYNNSKDAGCSNDITLAEVHVPKNSPTVGAYDIDDDEFKKGPVTVECRKSIDKLYDLMKKLGKVSSTDLKSSKSKLNITVEKNDAATGDSTIQGSDSGTSLKHHLTSSNPSCFSFGKTYQENPRMKATRKKDQTAPVVPKVIISSKLHAQKLETDKLKKDRKKVISSPLSKTVPENPLKAISQLLHEFDNVQKTRQKSNPDVKLLKKTEYVTSEVKTVMLRQNTLRRRSRIDQHLKENDQDKKASLSSPRDKRAKPLTPTEVAKIPYHQTAFDDKHTDKGSKKKITDIIDEAKEARGEAVRGPSKFNSRLISLAQPKRSYVQAHSEEYQHKYGKTMMADRLQRLATAPLSQLPASEPIIRNIGSPNSRNRVRREVTSSVSVKQPAPSVQPIDKGGRIRRSASSSPNRKPLIPTPTLHKHNVSDVPETIKKMVTADCYVKKHYGTSSLDQLRSELLLGGHKSRVPLLPDNIELASIASTPITEEANELGLKLHRIIDTMITTAPALSSLTECHETNSKLSRENTSTDNLSREQGTDSEFNFDILEDKDLETAVESLGNARDKEAIDEILETPDTLNDCTPPFNSTTELEKLENALYNHISGAFQKRLRIKNLTLTPKHSMQQLFLLQSGDAGSLIVKSTLSNKTNKLDAESLHDLKAVPVFSNSHLNWNFAEIPIQIATVGYALPLYQPACATKLDLTLNVSGTTISEHGSVKKSCKSDKISQCFKGVHQEPKFEQAAQVDVADMANVSKVIISTTEIAAKTPEKPLDDILVEELPKDIVVTAVSRANTPLIEEPEILKNKVEETSHSPENVDYTTSLDMLVGLLNEIQKITCQDPGKGSQCLELETILCNANALENNRSPDLVSMTSLDKLRQLESNPSIYSYYISSEGSPSSMCIVSEHEDKKPVFVDKEVSVNLYGKELMNTVTDVPSLGPIAVNHSTNVTNSLIGVLSETSSVSVISFADYHSLYSNTYFSSRQSLHKVVELSQIESIEKTKEMKKEDLNEKCCELVSQTFQVEEVKNKRLAANKIQNDPVKEEIDFDSVIKIKRDILVTVYSILVFTVFVALTIPDLAVLEC